MHKLNCGLCLKIFLYRPAINLLAHKALPTPLSREIENRLKNSSAIK